MRVVFKKTSATTLLVINPFGIGDVLFTTPLLRALKAALPHARIGYLCNRRTERILQHNPHLDQLFVYEKDEFRALWKLNKFQGIGYLTKLIQAIRRFHTTWVFDLSLSSRYAFVMRCIGIQRLVGFNYKKRGRFLSSSLPISGYHDQHVITYTKQLLAYVGIHMVDEHAELHVDTTNHQWAGQWLQENSLQDRQPLVGVIPAGGLSWGTHASFRRWHFEGFAAVADHLIEQHAATVILFGEKSDRASCEQVQKLMHHRAVDACGKTTLEQFVALMAHLDLLVCNDGGPLHLAVSQGVKTVSIFGPVDPHVYGPHPRSAQTHVVVYNDALPCRPCYHRFRLPPCPYERACLTEISAEDVIEACISLLQAGANAT